MKEKLNNNTKFFTTNLLQAFAVAIGAVILTSFNLTDEPFNTFNLSQGISIVGFVSIIWLCIELARKHSN